jgi:hypothetical protein
MNARSAILLGGVLAGFSGFLLLPWVRSERPSSPGTFRHPAHSRAGKPAAADPATADGALERRPADTRSTPAAQAVVTVTVVAAESRAPVPGALVRVDELADAEPVRSDHDGRALLALPAGRHLTLRADGAPLGAGSATLALETTPGPAAVELAVATDDEQRFFVRVVDALSEVPVSGALLTLQRPVTILEERSGETLRTLARGRSGPDGAFAFWVSDWGRQVVRVEAEGFASTFVQVTGGHTRPSDPYLVALARPATLVVHAAGGPDGTSLGLELVARAPFDDLLRRGESLFFLHGEDSVWRVGLDAQGRGTLTGLPPDVPLRIELVQGGTLLRRESRDFVLSAGETRTLSLFPGSGCTLAGRATLADGGAPASGVELWLLEAEARVGRTRFLTGNEVDSIVLATTTDDSGSFRLEGVQPGVWWLGPAPADPGVPASVRAEIAAEAVAPQAVRLTVEGGATHQEVELVLHRGRSIRGRVVSPEGVAIANALVDTGWGTNAVRTTEAGTFAYGPLVPGSYHLQADGQGWSRSEPVKAVAGERGVELVLLPGGSIRGRVVVASSGEPHRAELRVVPATPGQAGYHGLFIDTEPDGTFYAGGMRPGTYHLVASAAGAMIALLPDVAVADGTDLEGLVLALEPAARLVLVHDSDRARAFQVLYDDIPLGLVVVPPGQEVLVTVPPGDLVVQRIEGGSRIAEERPVEVELGESVELFFGSDD